MNVPTFWQIARRPMWIGVLVLCLAVAGAFAALGQWQISRAVEEATSTGPDTETPVPLREIATPQQPIDPLDAWRRVEVSLDIVPDDGFIVSERINTGEPGYWVVLHGVDDEGASLVVAAGWTDDVHAAIDAATDASGYLGVVTGRYLPSEHPNEGDFESGELTRVSAAEFVNLWSELPEGGTYAGYLVLDEPLDGLEPIDSPPPAEQVELNLLNVFYALEWVIFAGAAVFLWWRLVKDEVEKAQEAAKEREPVDAAPSEGDSEAAPERDGSDSGH